MKKLSLFLLGLFVASFAISQTTPYEVYAVKYSAAVHDSSFTKHEKDSVSIDFMVWLIKGNGKNILMDAGYLYSVESAKNFNVIDDLRPDSTFQKHTLNPQDVTDIILSYQHLDHISSIDLFPHAQVWVQKDDYNYFTNTAWQKGGVNGAFNKREVKKLVDVHGAGRVTLFEGYNKEIIQGLKIFPGSRNPSLPQYALVKTGVGNMALASDNIWIYYNSDFVTPAPAFSTFDANGYVKAMQKMQTLINDEKLIVPGYDGSAFAKFPVITEGVIRVK